ncbi:MAG: Hsp33 family molecular chaperone HslO [Clostridiales bacterium]|nr:Hsp33 family molecular chaperone HslO [Clostridiales bacterium]
MNKLYKTLIYDKQVSLTVMETTDMVNEAIKIHNLNKGAAKTLGGLLTCASYMSGCLKSEVGAISITVKAEGEVGTCSVSGDKDLHIRGYIDGETEGKLKGGYMTVIKDDGFFRPFVGTCQLVCDDVSENFMQYFHISEQIPTAVAVGVEIGDDGKCVIAGGVVMQLLPGTSQENMDKAENKMQNFVKVCEVLKEMGVEGIMQKLFKGETEEGFVYMYSPEYKCNCSRQKISKILLSMSKDELLSIVNEQGKVSVHCHYCNTEHEFFKEDILKLFNE